MGKFKLTCHNISFSGKDLVINPNSALKPGDVVEIELNSSPLFRLMLQIDEARDEIKPTDLSLSENIIKHFQIAKYEYYSVEKLDMPPLGLDVIEIVSRDQHLSRYDQIRFMEHIVGSCVYHKRVLDFSHMRCHLHAMWLRAHRVSSGYIDENTQVIFRTLTGQTLICLQISAELWNSDNHGDLYLEKMVDGFLANLFDKWKQLNCQHYVTITLFGRMTVDKDEESGADGDRNIPNFEDFYRVIFQYEQREDWSLTLPLIRSAVEEFAMDTEHKARASFAESGFEDLSNVGFSLVADGNMLEMLSHAAYTFACFKSNCQMDRMGRSCVVVTGGSGVFNVDRCLFNLTKSRFVDEGVDLVSVGEQPFHAVPVMKFKSAPNDSSSLNYIPVETGLRIDFDDYYLPDFINMSFYRTPTGREDTRCAGIVPYEFHIEEFAVSILPDRYALGFSGKIPRSLQDMIDYDKAIFKSDHEREEASRSKSSIKVEPTRRRYLTCDYAGLLDNNSYEVKCRSEQVVMLRNTYVDSPEMVTKDTRFGVNSHLSDSRDYSMRMLRPQRSSSLNSGIRKYLKKSTSNEPNAHLGVKCPSTTTRGKIRRIGLFNPFNIKANKPFMPLTHCRWINTRPKDADGFMRHPHHIFDAEEEVEIIGGHIDDCPIETMVAYRRRSSDFLSDGHSLRNNQFSPLRNKAVLERLRTLSANYGPTDWKPNALITVDWKSLTIPASLPLFVDRILNRERLSMNYTEQTSAIYPELMKRQCAHTYSKISSAYSATQVFNDMIGLRLSQGYQIVAFEQPISKRSAKAERWVKENFSMPIKSAQDTILATEVLTDGHDVHALVSLQTGFGEGDQLKIVQLEFRPKIKNFPQLICGHFYYQSVDDTSFTRSQCSFNYKDDKRFPWSRWNGYLSLQGSDFEDISNFEESNFWRVELCLFPTQCESNECCSEDYQHNTLKLNLTDMMDRARRFASVLEVLNKLRRVNPPSSSDDAQALNISVWYKRLTTVDECDQSTREFTTQSDLKDVMRTMVTEVPVVIDIADACGDEGNEGLPKKTFVSAFLVWWCLYRFHDIEDELDAIRYCQKLLDANKLAHISESKQFRYGFHLYYFVTENDKTAVKINRDFLEVDFCLAKNMLRFIDRTGFRNCKPSQMSLMDNRSSGLRIKGSAIIEFDSNRQSNRHKEWVPSRYSTFYHPLACFKLTVRWLVCATVLLSELIASWCRRSLYHGFTMVPIPNNCGIEFQSRMAEIQLSMKGHNCNSFTSFSSPLHLDCIRRPTPITLNTHFLNDVQEFLELSNQEQNMKLYAFQELILLRFGFVMHDASGDNNAFPFYVHHTGQCLACISRTLDANHQDDSEPGFLWLVNLKGCKRWRPSSQLGKERKFMQHSTLNMSTVDVGPCKLKISFTSFCENVDDRLKSFWNECSL